MPRAADRSSGGSGRSPSSGEEGAGRVLLVEDDALLRRALVLALEAAGFAVRSAGDAAEAATAVGEESFDVVVTDIGLPRGDGLDLVRRIRRESATVAVFVMTGDTASEPAAAALRAGANDYLVKPVVFRDLVERVRRAADWRRLAGGRGGPAPLRGDARAREVPRDGDTRIPALIGQSAAFRDAVALAERYAASALTVLITGETGVGKDVIARYIHAKSPRRDGPFVACNVTAVAETLVESELFGHVRGAFTGADRAKKGLVEVAAGGTLFLDEIGDVPPPIQVKMLRFLESREYYRVGDPEPRDADVRIVAATNASLEDAIGRGFRRDLYYRLNSARIILPPLRERRDDVLPLAEAFLLETARRGGRPFLALSPAVRSLFLEYPWDGNVRELKNAVESAAAVAEGETITVADLPMHLHRYAASHRAGLGERMAQRIEDAERRVIEEALVRAGGDKTVAARELGISLRTLYRKLQRSAGGSPADDDDRGA